MGYEQLEDQWSRRDVLGAAGLIGLGALLEACSSNSVSDTPETAFATQPDWEQNFRTMPNGPIDDRIWKAEIGNSNGWGNDEKEYYTNRQRNVRVQNGQLLITARHEAYGGQDYTSTRLDTSGGRFSFTYGKLVADIKLPAGVGTWPAFWLWPADPRFTAAANMKGPTWILNGELDIMEAVGAEPGQVFASVHTYDQLVHQPNGGQRGKSVPTSTSAYHRYGIEKKPDSISFTVDGVVYFESRRPRHSNAWNWPFDQPYYVILNLAMGGSWGGEDHATYPPYGIDNASGPWHMAVRSVAHYPLLAA